METLKGKCISKIQSQECMKYLHYKVLTLWQAVNTNSLAPLHIQKYMLCILTCMMCLIHSHTFGMQSRNQPQIPNLQPHYVCGKSQTVCLISVLVFFIMQNNRTSPKEK